MAKENAKGPEYRLPKARPPRMQVEAKRWPWALAALGVVGLAADTASRSFVPHIERATKAQILAVLPTEFVAPELRDHDAETRFIRFAHLLHKGFEKEDAAQTKQAADSGRGWPAPYHAPSSAEIADLERRSAALAPKVKALLRTGEIQAPPRRTQGGSIHDWERALVSEGALLRAAKQGNRKRCLEATLWRIELAQRVARAGVSIDDPPSFGQSDSFQTLEPIYLAEMAGGYDDAGRGQVVRALRLMDPAGATSARRVQRYFREAVLPALVEIAKTGDYWRVHAPKELPELRAGTFDPVETARLMVAYAQAMIEDLRSPTGNQVRALSATIRARFRDFPNKRGGIFDTEDYWSNLKWRVAMNRCRNSLGAEWALSWLNVDPDAIRDHAARVNAVIAVFRLHQGRTDLPSDPYGTGALRFDPKRRLVWSVGRDGVNDEAEAVQRYPTQAGEPKDLVYPY